MNSLILVQIDGKPQWVEISNETLQSFFRSMDSPLALKIRADFCEDLRKKEI